MALQLLPHLSTPSPAPRPRGPCPPQPGPAGPALPSLCCPRPRTALPARRGRLPPPQTASPSSPRTSLAAPAAPSTPVLGPGPGGHPRAAAHGLRPELAPPRPQTATLLPRPPARPLLPEGPWRVPPRLRPPGLAPSPSEAAPPETRVRGPSHPSFSSSVVSLNVLPTRLRPPRPPPTPGAGTSAVAVIGAHLEGPPSRAGTSAAAFSAPAPWSPSQLGAKTEAAG